MISNILLKEIRSEWNNTLLAPIPQSSNFFIMEGCIRFLIRNAHAENFFIEMALRYVEYFQQLGIQVLIQMYCDLKMDMVLEEHSVRPLQKIDVFLQ